MNYHKAQTNVLVACCMRGEFTMDSYIEIKGRYEEDSDQLAIDMARIGRLLLEHEVFEG